VFYGEFVGRLQQKLLRLDVKCLIFFSCFNQIWIFSAEFHRSPPVSKFMEIRPVEPRWCMGTEGRIWKKPIRRFSLLCENA